MNPKMLAVEKLCRGDWKNFGNLRIGVATIQPDAAEIILSHHDGKENRSEIKHNMVKLIRAFSSGQFRLTGETIIFDWDGDLRDGRHRVKACAATGVEFQAVVVCGVDPEIFYVIGQGAKRTLQNVLTMNGEKNTAGLGAAIGYLHLFLATGMLYRANSLTISSLTIDDSLDVLEAHPRLRDSTAFCHNHSMIPRYAGGVGLNAAMHYLCSRYSPRLANAYYHTFDALAKANIGEHSLSPRWTVMATLWRLLNNNYNSTRKMDQKGVSHLLVRAWNAILENRCSRSLMYRSGDSYPQLAGWGYDDDGIPIAPDQEMDGVEVPDFLI